MPETRTIHRLPRRHESAPGPLGKLRAMASALVSRNLLSSAAGVTFGGDRDLYEAFGYKRTLTVEDYWERFYRNGVAQRIVTAYPRATWRGFVQLIEDENPDVITDFEASWFEINARLEVVDVFRRADKMAGIGTYAGIVIGAPGDLDEPLPAKLRMEDISFLQPYPERDLDIYEIEDDITQPNFGMPTSYKLNNRTFKGKKLTSIFTRGVNQVIDASRVLLVGDELLEDNITSLPRLESCWNDLDDLEKVKGGGAESFYRRSHQGYVFNMDKDVEMSPEDEDALVEEFQEFTHGFRRNIQGRGLDVKALGSDVANFSNPVDAIFTILAATTGIPKRIIQGSERGELASGQDSEHWDDQVSDRRTEIAEPRFIRPFVDLMISLGVMPAPIEYAARWPVREQSMERKVGIADKMASANQKNGEVIFPANEIRDLALELEPLDEADTVDDSQGNETKPEAEPEQLPVAAMRHTRSRRAGTVLDKRRLWWRRIKEERKKKESQVTA